MVKQRITEHFLQLPLARKAALICAVICATSALLLIMANYQGGRELIRHSSQLFGDSLARQLAVEASNPLVQSDRLSLQSLLNKLIESPLVVHGVIYDVGNRPLVEAGNATFQGQSLSASITFQDSIAGYAVITLDTSPLQQRASALGWRLLLLALLLSAGGYAVSWWPARYVSAALNDLAVIAAMPAHKRHPNTRINYSGHDELQHLARQLLTGPGQHAAPSPAASPGATVVAIRLDNLAALQQANSEPQWRDWLQTLQRQLTMIGQLYGGQLIINRSDSFCLVFSADDREHNDPFKALCSGHLLMQWQQAGPLVLAAGLIQQMPSTDQRHNNDLSQQLAAQSLFEQARALACCEGRLVLADSLYQHASIHGRVIVSPLPESAEVPESSGHQLDTLKAPYDGLLAHQLESLQTQLNR